jgi:hypothetical protein
VSAGRLQVLRDVKLKIEDMPGPYLGLTVGDQIWLSRNAAGYGWFTNPGDDSAFATGQAHGMDLLTTVMHEFGHVLGYEDDGGTGAMAEALAPGTRHEPQIPGLALAANAVSSMAGGSHPVQAVGSVRPSASVLATPEPLIPDTGLLIPLDTPPRGPLERNPFQSAGHTPAASGTTTVRIELRYHTLYQQARAAEPRASLLRLSTDDSDADATRLDW